MTTENEVADTQETSLNSAVAEVSAVDQTLAELDNGINSLGSYAVSVLAPIVQKLRSQL